MVDEFINEFADQIADCVYCKKCHKGITINIKSLGFALERSLGKSAFKMLKIGILQDQLVTLGFGFEKRDAKLDLYQINSMFDKKHRHIMFWKDLVFVRDEIFYYDSPTFIQDVLTKVKELINYE